MYSRKQPFSSANNDPSPAGVGSVVVFLPQIVILFFFILVMEASGYMARAAFLIVARGDQAVPLVQYQPRGAEQ